MSAWHHALTSLSRVCVSDSVTFTSIRRPTTFFTADGGGDSTGSVVEPAADGAEIGERRRR